MHLQSSLGAVFLSSRVHLFSPKCLSFTCAGAGVHPRAGAALSSPFDWYPSPSLIIDVPFAQVLVSIQGLVLVPEPYYNEAGYGRQVRSAPGPQYWLRSDKVVGAAVCCGLPPCATRRNLAPPLDVASITRNLGLHSAPLKRVEQVGSAGSARNSVVHYEHAFRCCITSPVRSCTFAGGQRRRRAQQRGVQRERLPAVRPLHGQQRTHASSGLQAAHAGPSD